LIVETDKDFLSALSSYLKDKGYWVLSAENQRHVKKIMRKNNIDVVLLGMISLKRTALSVLKWIKKRSPLTEVILINKGDQISLSIEGMKLGAFDDFLIPLDLASLDECLRKAWESKKSRKMNRLIINRYQRMIVAATYAEADEHDYAIEILRNNDLSCSQIFTLKRKSPRGKRNN